MNAAADVFLQEARELVDGLETSLLALEDAPDPEHVDAVFRALHTIKGSGAMFGFTTLAAFVHHFETAFERVRTGDLAIDRRLVDLSLDARDHVTALLDCGADGPAASALAEGPEAVRLLSALEALTGGREAAAAPSAKATMPAAAGLRRFAIRFAPGAEALAAGMRPDLLIEELADLGESAVRLDARAVPPLDRLDPRVCHLVWQASLVTTEPRRAVEAVFVFADETGLSIEEDTVPAPPPARLAPARAAAPDKAPDAAPDAAPTEETVLDPRRESVRVSATRLDEAMDRVGELTIAQSRLARLADGAGDPALSGVVEEIERLVAGLREGMLSLRMLPVETVFSRFRRVVRDLSADLGKEVRLSVVGAETEVDKSVLDRLSEPLVHLVRNAVDHGIEPAEARRAAGKPAAGTLTLSARQDRGEILIEIEDDGAGLDAEAIRARAVERGLIGADERPSTEALHQMIFAPGFSTARRLSNVSGRGVGMDAVRSTIEALRGRVAIETEPGRGTRLTLGLPLTLAIIDGFAVRLGTGVHILPLSMVEECLEHDAATSRDGASTILLRGQLVPVLDLARLFGLDPGNERERRIVVVRAGAERAGLVIDDVLGQHQTVVKPLGAQHRDVPGLAGASILGDGRVALVLDPAALVSLAAREHRPLHRPLERAA